MRYVWFFAVLFLAAVQTFAQSPRLNAQSKTLTPKPGSMKGSVSPAAALFEQGLNKFYEEKFEAAIQTFSKAIQQDSMYARAFHMRGESYVRLKKQEEALQNFNQAILIAGDYEDYLYSRANLYADLKNYPAAVQDYDRVLALRPRYPEALLDRAQTKLAMGDKMGACTDLKQAAVFGLTEATLLQQCPTQ